MTNIYRNISFAAAASFRDILESGVSVVVRESETKEITNQVTVLERPHQRFLFLPDRLNDCFAQIAESLWVLAGRSDIQWLTHYLRRAPEFSDDGKTWRAGYGPRLRQWPGGIDQVDEVRKLLQNDPFSRRAVMVLFDPQRDYVTSVDIPCNNLLSWLIRNGRLHLNVVLRSNDAMWGFSGANAFEWSILHELLASWLGVAIGPVTFFAASFHLYKEHWDRAGRISSKFQGATPYEFGVEHLPIKIKWDDLDRSLNTWFELEQMVRSNPFAEIVRLNELDDEFLRMSLQTIRLYWLDKISAAGIPDEMFAKSLGAMRECDLVAAAYEYFGRSRPNLLKEIPHPNISQYFSAASGKQFNEMNLAIKKLHAAKDRAYGGAWKKRGELISVLSNIARKVDRLEVYVSSRHALVGETILDTAVDLFVYAGKYQLFLEDIIAGDLLSASAPTPFADYDENFEAIVDTHVTGNNLVGHDADDLIRQITNTFERLWPLASDESAIEERKSLAAALTEVSAKLVEALRKSHPGQTASFIRTATL